VKHRQNFVLGEEEEEEKEEEEEEEEEEDTMRGGSLTRFRTDEWYDQQGKELVTDLLRGGFQGLKSTRNPLKLPSNKKRGLETD